MRFAQEKKHRLIAAALLAVLLAVFIGGYFSVIYQSEYSKYFMREAIALAGYTGDACSTLQHNIYIQNELVSMESKHTAIRLKIVMNELTQSLAVGLPENCEADIYILDAGFNTIYESADIPLSLSESELRTLIRDGKLNGENRCFLCEKSEDNYYIVALDLDTSYMADMDLKLTEVYSYLVFDNETGLVSGSGGEKVTEALTNITLSDLDGAALETVDGVEIRRVTFEGKKWLCGIRSVSTDGGEMTLCLFTEEGSSARTAFFSVSCSAFFLLLFALCCVFILQRLKKKWESLPLDSRFESAHSIPHFRPLKRHIIGVIDSMAVLFLAGSMLLFSLHNIMQINTEVSSAYTSLSLVRDGYNAGREKLREALFQSGFRLLDSISGTVSSDSLDNPESWQRDMNEILNQATVTVYNEEGEVVLTTTSYMGYRLSTDPEDSEYRLRKLLTGSTKQVSYYVEAEDTYYMAMRRTDDVGILLLGIPGSGMDNLLHTLTLPELLAVQNFPGAYKMYIMRSSQETLHLLSSDGASETVLTNTLPLPDSGNSISGTRKLNGELCLFCDLGSVDGAVIIAYPLSSLTASDLSYFYITVAFYVFFAAVLTLLLGRKRTAENELTANAADMYSAFTEEEKKLFPGVVSVLALAMMAASISKCLFFIGSVALSDFFDLWEKGLNLVSVGYAVLAAGICFGIVLFINILDSLIGRLFSSKGKTICALLMDLIKVMIVLAYLVKILEKFGVNATAIAASLGLSGLALSIGCKDVISDMVAGIFIIFEGQIQLGDYIQVSGFSGIVQSLGIRTVKIKAGNKEMILNNSEIKNVLNMSRGLSAIILSPVLPFETDIVRMQAAVEGAQERFQTACDGKLTSDMRFTGVTEFAEYGMQCTFKASCLGKDSKLCTPACATELIKILNENGFRIATRQ